ncbi:MAG: hypothetical protein K9J12_09890 [Melioribacteraceae bacterium]|nr:hypothetical protein [Melioribacteraceae bacterium]
MFSRDEFLYSPVRYSFKQNTYEWFDQIPMDNQVFHWDVSSFLSMISYNYVLGQKTLLREIRRNSWISTFQGLEEVSLPIPEHDYNYFPNLEIANKLKSLLKVEILNAISEYREIYILLSGGLDSRILAGLIYELKRENLLANKNFTAVTWGIKNSRDVIYAQIVADLCDINWQHIELGPLDLIENLNLASFQLGGLVSAVHLHKMNWFKNISPNSLVMAASYGDSIGRAEYSGKHLLQLELIKPKDKFGLFIPEYQEIAIRELESELLLLRSRSISKEKFILVEYEMQAHYMRNMIAHAMSIIRRNCEIYQIFTAPEVYKFIWSLHPSIRTNEIYNQILISFNNAISSVPWARTNKALSGQTKYINRFAKTSYHMYEDWIKYDLIDDLFAKIDLDWINSIPYFNQIALNKYFDLIKQRKSKLRFKAYDLFLWFVQLDMLAKRITLKNSEIKFMPIEKSNTQIKADDLFVEEAFLENKYLNKFTKKMFFVYNNYKKKEILNKYLKSYELKIK